MASATLCNAQLTFAGTSSSKNWNLKSGKRLGFREDSLEIKLIMHGHARGSRSKPVSCSSKPQTGISGGNPQKIPGIEEDTKENVNSAMVSNSETVVSNLESRLQLLAASLAARSAARNNRGGNAGLESNILVQKIAELQDMVIRGHRGTGVGNLLRPTEELKMRVNALRRRAELLQQMVERSVTAGRRVPPQVSADLQALEREYRSLENILRLSATRFAFSPKAGTKALASSDQQTSQGIALPATPMGQTTLKSDKLLEQFPEQSLSSGNESTTKHMQATGINELEASDTDNVYHITASPSGEISQYGGFRDEIQRRVRAQMNRTVEALSPTSLSSDLALEELLLPSPAEEVNLALSSALVLEDLGSTSASVLDKEEEESGSRQSVGETVVTDIASKEEATVKADQSSQDIVSLFESAQNQALEIVNGRTIETECEVSMEAESREITTVSIDIAISKREGQEEKAIMEVVQVALEGEMSRVSETMSIDTGAIKLDDPPEEYISGFIQVEEIMISGPLAHAHEDVDEEAVPCSADSKTFIKLSPVSNGPEHGVVEKDSKSAVEVMVKQEIYPPYPAFMPEGDDTQLEAGTQPLVEAGAINGVAVKPFSIPRLARGENPRGEDVEQVRSSSNLSADSISISKNMGPLMTGHNPQLPLFTDIRNDIRLISEASLRGQILRKGGLDRLQAGEFKREGGEGTSDGPDSKNMAEITRMGWLKPTERKIDDFGWVLYNDGEELKPAIEVHPHEKQGGEEEPSQIVEVSMPSEDGGEEILGLNGAVEVENRGSEEEVQVGAVGEDTEKSEECTDPAKEEEEHEKNEVEEGEKTEEIEGELHTDLLEASEEHQWENLQQSLGSGSRLVAGASVSIEEAEESLHAHSHEDKEVEYLPLKPHITLHYQTGWEVAYLHYSIDSKPWTEVPGVLMETMHTMDDEAPWKVLVLEGESLEFVLTNGQNDWDKSPQGGNYIISKSGTYLLSFGNIQEVHCVSPVELVG